MKQFRNTQYYLTEDGNVINKKNNIKKYQISNSGYKRVCLQIDGKQTLVSIHRMIAECYIPNIDNKQMVNHKDGDKLNNNYLNLEWVTRKQNEEHAKNNGLKASKERHGMSKLTQDDVNWIRKNYLKKDKDFGRQPISKKFGVTPQLIDYIINNKIWKICQ
jgi:hypothetical protein